MLKNSMLVCVLVLNTIFFSCKEKTEVEIQSQVSQIETFIDFENELETKNQNKIIDGVIFSNDEKILISYPKLKSETNYLIPSSVVEIAEKAFSGNQNLRTIVLPYSLKKICDSAFENCSALIGIEIPNNVKEIGNGIFLGCSSLKYCVFPENFKKVPEAMFSNCISLSEPQFPKNVEEIGQSAFSGCTSISKVNFPKSINIISAKCFFGCTSLTSVNLQNISFIDSYAFSESGLKSFFVPASVSKIAECAFNNCPNLTAISVDSKNPSYRSDDGILLSKNGSSLHVYPSGKKSESFSVPIFVTRIEPSAFSGNQNLKFVKISAGVKQISFDAFSNCSALESVKFSNGVEKIAAGAFSDCVSLKSIELSEKLFELGAFAFSNCSALSEIKIPSSVKKIGISAFLGCTSLSKIDFKNKSGWFFSPPPNFEKKILTENDFVAKDFTSESGKFSNFLLEK